MNHAPFVDSVFHPSDFSEGSHLAFVHALAIALYRQARLTIMHVVPRDRAVDEWSESPQVRATLERWGILAQGSARAAVFGKLAMRVEKINVRHTDPLKAILGELERRPSDLIVLSTEAREGLPRWIKPSVAERVTRESKTMTLFVPGRAAGFVDAESGKITLRRILIPVDHHPSPRAALCYAARVAVASHEEQVELILLRVGPVADWPSWDLPELQSCKVEKVHRKGEVVEEIIGAAGDLGPDLIVMATEGTTGILDALRGSVTEQVLRRAPCALLAVPAGMAY